MGARTREIETREIDGWTRKWGARTRERSKAGPESGEHEIENEGWAREWGARGRSKGSTREIERQGIDSVRRLITYKPT
jgi:hypothetical protein